MQAQQNTQPPKAPRAARKRRSNSNLKPKGDVRDRELKAPVEEILAPLDALFQEAIAKGVSQGADHRAYSQIRMRWKAARDGAKAKLEALFARFILQYQRRGGQLRTQLGTVAAFQKWCRENGHAPPKWLMEAPSNPTYIGHDPELAFAEPKPAGGARKQAVAPDAPVQAAAVPAAPAAEPAKKPARFTKPRPGAMGYANGTAQPQAAATAEAIEQPAQPAAKASGKRPAAPAAREKARGTGAAKAPSVSEIAAQAVDDWDKAVASEQAAAQAKPKPAARGTGAKAKAPKKATGAAAKAQPPQPAIEQPAPAQASTAAAPGGAKRGGWGRKAPRHPKIIDLSAQGGSGQQPQAQAAAAPQAKRRGKGSGGGTPSGRGTA